MRDTAPGADLAEAVGYALLSRDHKHDPEVHGPPDVRLYSGDVVPKPRLAAGSESAPVYTMLDGTHRLYARHEMNAATTGGGHVEPLPGTYADISTELGNGGYAALTNPVSESVALSLSRPPGTSQDWWRMRRRHSREA